MCTEKEQTYADVLKAVQELVSRFSQFTAATVQANITSGYSIPLPVVGAAVSKIFSAGLMGLGYSCTPVFNLNGRKLFKLYQWNRDTVEANEGNLLRFNRQAFQPAPEEDDLQLESETDLVVSPELVIHDGKFYHKNCINGKGPNGYGQLEEPDWDILTDPAVCHDCGQTFPRDVLELAEKVAQL